MSWWSHLKRNSLSLAPSMLGADLARLGEEVAAVEAAGVELLHLDIMDGVFVPNISFGADVCAAIARHATVPLDCHLMIERPERYLEVFREAGCHGLTVHLETMSDPIATLKQIRALGGLAGLAVNPSTELPPVGPLWEHLDLLLVMSVQPGFCGQSFHPEVLGKLESARALREETGLEFALQIDGGVGPAVAGAARAAGADIMVAASAIMGREDRAAAALEMRQAAG